MQPEPTLQKKETALAPLQLLSVAKEPQIISPEDARIENLRKNFEARVKKLEEQVDLSIQKLEHQFETTLQKMPTSKSQSLLEKDLLHSINLIETKIKSLAQPIRHDNHPPKANLIKKLNYYFNKLTSLKTYKRAVFGGPKRLDKQEFDEFGRDPAFEKKVKPFFDFLYHDYWRVSPHGLDHIPSNGAALIVSNHSGTLPFDGSMIRLAVTNDHPARRDVRFLVEDFVYYLPFLGTFMYRIGGVRASPDNAERLLRKGHLVTVFPEGEKGIGKSYKHRYHLQRFGRGGFIKLAIRTGVPIVPCAVIGAEETQPLLYKTSFLTKPFGIPYVPITPTLPWLGPLGLIGLPAKWHVYFGKPISLKHYGQDSVDDELLIHRLSEMVRTQIQEMVMEGLKKRRSVWY